MSYAQNKYYYDNNGNVVKTMVKNGTEINDYSVTETQYNWRNAPIKVLTDGTDTAYCYDDVGNVLRMYTGELQNFTINGLDDVSGADYEVTKYTYDTQNRMLTSTDALGKTASNVYDLNGNVVKTTDRNGTVYTPTYGLSGKTWERYTSTDDTNIDLGVTRGFDGLGRVIGEGEAYIDLRTESRKNNVTTLYI